MRKIFTLVAALSIWCSGANAQFVSTMKKLDIFNHLGVAAGIGTTGVTLDLGTTVTPWVQLRAGVDIMPELKMNTTLGLKEVDGTPTINYLEEIDVQGKLSNTTGHLLFDIYPFAKRSSFHVTVGGYFGGDKLIAAYNTSGQDELKDIYNYNHRLGQYGSVPDEGGKIGAVLGDYFIEPDENGNVGASIRVKKFRPYLGLGFGRMAPKSRVSCMFDLGVQFWGNPSVWNDTANERLVEEKLNGEDGGIIKTISKVSVYPVLSIKIVGKIF